MQILFFACSDMVYAMAAVVPLPKEKLIFLSAISGLYPFSAGHWYEKLPIGDF